jgi:terminal uridylyltransferase
VTHNGIVSIRDEFRRAWRIIRNIGKGNEREGLLDPASTDDNTKSGLRELLDMIHGPEVKAGTTPAQQGGVGEETR